MQDRATWQALVSTPLDDADKACDLLAQTLATCARDGGSVIPRVVVNKLLQVRLVVVGARGDVRGCPGLPSDVGAI